jgi:sulfite dehydrogenase (quinone) subunit SoeC
MTQTSDSLVGNSFRLGYRFQRYWDTSMALAFFSAETGAGLFVLSLLLGYLPGMIVGLALVGTLKPYFHLAHMGVPQKSWRAVLRPDRSWISRGTLSIGVLVGCGALHILDRAYGLQASLGVPAVVAMLAGWGALAAGLMVMCYQGFAMAHSDALALWASPLVPLSSLLYSASAGVLLLLVLGSGSLETAQLQTLRYAAVLLLLADIAVVQALLAVARRKSRGGAFSAQLLTQGQFARHFRNLVIGLGQLLPLVAMLLFGGFRAAAVLASIAMLCGFFAFRLLMFRAAVFEPITHDLAGSLGLPLPR